MQDHLLDFVVGAAVGGLALSALWGLFWLTIGSIGLLRRTCGWRVVLNSLVVGVVPLLLMGGVVWARGQASLASAASGFGLAVMPALLAGLALRPAPDGQRAGAHMLGGVRHLMDELLGKHQGCGGCDHEHDHGGCR